MLLTAYCRREHPPYPGAPHYRRVGITKMFEPRCKFLDPSCEAIGRDTPSRLAFDCSTKSKARTSHLGQETEGECGLMR